MSTTTTIAKREFRMQGPPGTGKTTWLSRQIKLACDKYGGTKVAVSSLTRAAAAHVASATAKDALTIPPDNIGTLHALAYRAVGAREIAESKASLWNEYCAENGLPSLKLSDGTVSATSKVGAEDDIVEQTKSQDETAGDRDYAEMNKLRARMVPASLWPESTRTFYDSWRRWKNDVALHDFTDLLEIAYRDCATAPGDPLAFFGDESQDWSRLAFSLARKWGEAAMTFVHVGDPDQCQPAGTMVLTTKGEKPIEALNPETDRLTCYDRHCATVVGKRDGYSFQIASRPFSGSLVVVSSGGATSKSSEDHRWIARFDPQSIYTHCVYLMRRGDRWRVGWCQIFNSEGTFHVGARARLEDAEDCWILSVHENSASASVAEKITATEFGLPLITFSDRYGCPKEQIDAVFGGLNPAGQASRASACLAHFGRLAQHPIWRKGTGEKKGVTKVGEYRACNLIPGLMRLATYDGDRGVSWHPITVTRESYDGFLYSLNVEPHHNYFSDGILTCNCLYEWAGGDTESFFNVDLPRERRRILEQSYRIPRAVHALATAWIDATPNRRPVLYRPREEDGAVRRDVAGRFNDPSRIIDDAERQLADGKSVMFCASCAYLLQHVVAELRERGIPFHNPYRSKRGDWNPLNTRGTGAAVRLAAFAQAEPKWTSRPRQWTAQDVHRWGEWMTANKCGMLRGAKSIMKEEAAAEPSQLPNPVDVVRAYFENQPCLDGSSVWESILGVDVDWWISTLPPEKQKSVKYPRRVLERGGVESLREKPKVIVSTIHGAKGGEADVVYLMPDLSPMAYTEWMNGGRGREGVRRAFYVGITRARSDLVILGSGSNMAVRL